MTDIMSTHNHSKKISPINCLINIIKNKILIFFCLLSLFLNHIWGLSYLVNLNPVQSYLKKKIFLSICLFLTASLNSSVSSYASSSSSHSRVSRNNCPIYIYSLKLPWFQSNGAPIALPALTKKEGKKA